MSLGYLPHVYPLPKNPGLHVQEKVVFDRGVHVACAEQLLVEHAIGTVIK